MRKPTPKQALKLRLLGSGSIVVTPRRTDWGPLLRHGWVERADPSLSPRGGFLPPLRITAEGYRALAGWLERDGWPS